MRVAPSIVIVAALGGAVLAPVVPALAAPASEASGAEAEAVRRYRAGKQLIAKGQFAEALAELEASRELMPSPNTDLLVGHALRELGRKGEAMTVYERVLGDAGARVRSGEARFKPTLEEAGRWSALLRAELAVLVIVVPGAPKGTALELDGAAVESQWDEASGELRARLWHEPGTVEVKASGDGRERTAPVTLEAGGEQRLDLALPTGPEREVLSLDGESDADTESSGEPGSAVPPVATWVTAGIGVVGFAFFAGFGAASASTASDLDECAPRCGEEMREAADEGARNQIIANVSLIVGATALAAAGTIWLVTALVDDEATAEEGEPEPATEPADAEVALGVRAGGLVLRARF